MPTRSRRAGAALLLTLLGSAAAGLVSLPTLAPRLASQRQRIKRFRAALDGARYMGDAGVSLQTHRNDCAAACLKMVLASRGIERDLSSLERDTGTSPAGASIAGLRTAAALAGLDSRAWSLTAADLRRAPLPAIAFIHNNHFVVIRRFVGPDLLEIDDPAMGRVHWPVAAFKRAWKGETVVFKPDWDPTRN